MPGDPIAAVQAGNAVLLGQGDGTYDEALDAIRLLVAAIPSETDRLQARVAEVVEEDGGCWHACSGCQESVEGYVSARDYPFSPLFQCQPGGGCRECGGIGVLWQDGAFLASYGEALAPEQRA